MKSVFVPFPNDRALMYAQCGLWQNQTIFEFFRQACQQYAPHVAVIQQNESLTYSQFYNQAIAQGISLKKDGINANDFVLLQSVNSIGFLVVLFGLYFIGAKPIFCLDGYRAYEIEAISNRSHATAYIRIVHDNVEGQGAEDIVHNFVHPTTLKVIKTLSQKSILNLECKVSSQILPYPSNPRDIAFLQLSGGTTGIPKLIPRTHDDYLYSVRQSAKIAGLGTTTKQLIVLPISHNFTMSSPGFLGAIYAGATMIIADNSSPSNCFALIEQHKITQTSLVPSLMLLWLNSPLREKYDLSSLQVIQVGGAKFPAEIASRSMDTFNVTIQQVYGMAEGLVNFTRLDDDRDTIINTQGKKLSEYDEIRIVDSNGNEVPHGEQGVITTRGPYTINGYYNAADANAKSFTSDGFYITGDIGYLDDNRNIIVTGRMKELINRAGEKIMPSEIENLLLSHPLIHDVIVQGIPDALMGERIKAKIIVSDTHAHLTLADIRKFLMTKHIALNKLPDEIEVVSQFEYTLVGKVKR